MLKINLQLFSSKKGIKILKEAYSIKAKDKDKATLSIKKLKPDES